MRRIRLWQWFSHGRRITAARTLSRPRAADIHRASP